MYRSNSKKANSAKEKENPQKASDKSTGQSKDPTTTPEQLEESVEFYHYQNYYPFLLV